MGKSSTANSLLNERVANVAALQSDVSRPQVIARSADGFTLTLIDTPGLLEADAVSDAVRRHRSHRPVTVTSLAYMRLDQGLHRCLSRAER